MTNIKERRIIRIGTETRQKSLF